MKRIIIKNVLLDGEEKNILIEGNIIKKISCCETVYDDTTTKAAKIIEAKGKAVIPGLINMHTHSAMTLMRGIYEDAKLNEWLSYIWKVEPRLDEEMIYWGTRLACLEMLKSGTTTFNDQYWMTDTAVKAIAEMGLRSMNSYVFLDMNDTSKDEYLKEECLKVYEKSASWSGLNKFTVAVHAPYSVSGSLMLWANDFAVKNNLLLHIHLSETAKEQEDSFRLHKLSPTGYLESLGMLSPKVLAAHCVWMSEKDIELLALHDVKIVHNINSNLKLASGYKFKYKEFKDAGLTADDVMTCSVSIAEEEVSGIGASYLDGHLVSWNYYQTTDTPENEKFVSAYKARYGEDRVTDDPIEAGYDAVYLWAAAVEKAGTTDVDAVREAAAGITFDAPEGTI